MEEFLKKIKFITEFETEIELNLNDFIKRLSKIVEKSELGIFSRSFEFFSSNPEVYKGKIENSYFKIRRKRKFFDINMNFSTAEGKCIEKDGLTMIKTKINGPKALIIPFYIILPIFYITMIFGIASDKNVEALFIIPFIIIHAIFMFSIPYFVVTRSVKNMKYELEREFFYLTKKEKTADNSGLAQLGF